MSRTGLVTLLMTLGVTAACGKSKGAPGVQDLTSALAAVPETGVPVGVYQHYKFQHQQIDSMRADLKALVAAESAYFADSQKYTNVTSCLTPPTGGAAHWCASRSDNLDAIRITTHGWHTTISNLNTVVFCGIQVGNDTSYGTPPGVPACFVSQPPPGYPKAR